MKRRYGVTSEKTAIFIITDVRTPGLTMHRDAANTVPRSTSTWQTILGKCEKIMPEWPPNINYIELCLIRAHIRMH
jgi:hypothetical protein